MKKFAIILTILLAMTIITNAQIPNNGFEDWTTIGSYEDPTAWATMNFVSAGTFYSCTKSTDHYPENVGIYSIRLENNTSLTQMTGAYGMAMTNAFDWPFKPAFPVTGNPTSLTGYYKYESFNNDSMFIRIVLFENSIMLGNSIFVTGISTSIWTSFNIPFSNYSSADSATIQLSAFYPESETDGPNGNSVLYVDNLNFDNLITSTSELTKQNMEFNLYPNPAFDIVTLNIDNTNNTDLTLNIYNVTGKLIGSEKLQQNQQQINIGDLNNGIYLFGIRSKEWTVKQKLIIQR